MPPGILRQSRASTQLPPKSCIANNTQNQKESLLNFLVKCLNFAMTPSFEADQPDAAAILSALPRSARRSLYREAKGDAKAAARLYVWSLHTSAQLLPYFNAIEGILAQKMSRVFTRAFGPAWWADQRLRGRLARPSLRKIDGLCKPHVGTDTVAFGERMTRLLGLGFWTNVIAHELGEAFWSPRIAPFISQAPSMISPEHRKRAMTRLREDRNAVAHGDLQLSSIQLEADFTHCCEVLLWLNPTLEAQMKQSSMFTSSLGARPV